MLLRYRLFYFFFFSSRRRHTRYWRDWSSDVCSSDLNKYFIDTTTSGIHQKFLELFIKRGLLEQHSDQLRAVLGKRMEYMIEILQKIPHLHILHLPKGGFFLWIELANYIDGEKFYYKCRLRRSEEHTSELQSRQYLVCR